MNHKESLVTGFLWLLFVLVMAVSVFFGVWYNTADCGTIQKMFPNAVAQNRCIPVVQK